MLAKKVYSFESILEVVYTDKPRAFIEAQAEALESDALDIEHIAHIVEAKDIAELFSDLGASALVDTIEFYNFILNMCKYVERRRLAGNGKYHSLSEHDAYDYSMDSYQGARQVVKALSAKDSELSTFENFKYLSAVVSYAVYDAHTYAVHRRFNQVNLDEFNESYALEALDAKTMREHDAIVKATTAQQAYEAIPSTYIERLGEILDKADASRLIDLVSKKATSELTSAEARAYQRLVNRVKANGQKLTSAELKAIKKAERAQRDAEAQAKRQAKKAKAEANKQARAEQKARAEQARAEAKAQAIESAMNKAKDLGGLSQARYRELLVQRYEAEQARKAQRRAEAKAIRQVLKGAL